MTRKLIIDGNAVYEIDEDCMLKNRVDDAGPEKRVKKPDVNTGRKCSEKYGRTWRPELNIQRRLLHMGQAS